MALTRIKTDQILDGAERMRVDISGNLLVAASSNRTTMSITTDSGIAVVPVTDLAQNEYVDINVTRGVAGAVMAVQLMVTNTLKANAAERTSSLITVFDRGLNNTSVQTISTANGGTAAAAFTVTVPSQGVIRITNTKAGTTTLSATAMITTGF